MAGVVADSPSDLARVAQRHLADHHGGVRHRKSARVGDGSLDDAMGVLARWPVAAVADAGLGGERKVERGRVDLAGRLHPEQPLHAHYGPARAFAEDAPLALLLRDVHAYSAESRV